MEKNSALAVRQMRVRMRELNFLHMSLQNLSTQASLIASFTVAELMYGAPHYLESDVKEFCSWKRWSHLTFVVAYYSSVLCCFSHCMFVVCISSQVIRLSQDAALHIDPAAAAERTRVTVYHIQRLGATAYGSFGLSAVLLIWLFIGLPKWVAVPYDSLLPLYDRDGDGTLNVTERREASLTDELKELVFTRQGALVVQCLDPYSDQQKHSLRTQGFSVAAFCAVAACVAVLRGVQLFAEVRRAFHPEVLTPWARAHLDTRAIRQKEAAALSEVVREMHGVLALGHISYDEIKRWLAEANAGTQSLAAGAVAGAERVLGVASTAVTRLTSKGRPAVRQTRPCATTSASPINGADLSGGWSSS